MPSEKDSLIKKEPNSERFFRILQPCLAEFVGTALFVFVATMCMQDPRTLTVAASHGFAITSLVMCFSHISGGHFNPAVSFGVLLGGGLHPPIFPFYVASQLIGGMLGAACTRGILGSIMIKGVGGKMISQYESIDGGSVVFDESVGVGRAILTDMLGCMFLVLAFLMTSVDSVGKSSRLAPFAVGFAYIVGILQSMQITGPSLNPARSFGSALCVWVYKPSIWKNHYIFWVGPFAGAIIAAFFFRFVFASIDHRIPRRKK
ncbi:aquaporin-8-like [Lineus longissimus]|uniref:aquaporin-8-like n=1 Tax=Lineus longissimus TaxID=88925 RepID=UPI002B4E716E